MVGRRGWMRRRVGGFELGLRDALLPVDFGFLGSVRVDGFLGEVVGAAARDYQGAPTVAG